MLKLPLTTMTVLQHTVTFSWWQQTEGISPILNFKDISASNPEVSTILLSEGFLVANEKKYTDKFDDNLS